MNLRAFIVMLFMTIFITSMFGIFMVSLDTDSLAGGLIGYPSKGIQYDR